MESSYPAPLRLRACWQAFVWVILAWFLLPRLAKAEGSASLKHQSYQERDGRIRVDSQYGMVEAQLPWEVKLKLVGVLDTISGATPTGQLDLTASDPVVLSEMKDRRKAWHAEFSRPWQRGTATLGLDNSRESDYVSDSLSLNTATDFNGKNTTLLAGFAAAHDEVRSFNPVGWQKKRAYDGLLGLTQLLDPTRSVTLTLTYGKASGYLNDPYKLVYKNLEVFPGVFVPATFSESRPDRREKATGLVTYNEALPSLHAAWEASYRFYRDTFGVQAHTVTAQWFQRLVGERLILNPSVRYHRQGAADFYIYNLDTTSLTPTDDPRDASQPYTSDYRLSKMETLNLGVKLVWHLVPDQLALDVSYDRYRMRGLDGVTAQTAYPTANIYTVGFKYTW